jgi:hypothetical protein
MPRTSDAPQRLGAALPQESARYPMMAWAIVIHHGELLRNV